MSKVSTAFVLSDVVSHGLKAGQVLEGSGELIKALSDAGYVDSNKAAVAAAREAGAAVVRSSIERARDELAARRSQLLAAIAQAEQALAAAKDEPTKAALAQALESQRAELAELAE